MGRKRDMDRRIQRTRQMLSEALFDLIAERGYDAVTVQDIAERANVGRATFYLHYRDKEELLAAILEDFVNGLVAYIDGTDFSSFQTMNIMVFKYVEQHQAIYRALLGEGGPPIIAIRMRNIIARLIERYILTPFLSEETTNVDVELVANYQAGALLAMVSWWLDHKLTPTAEEMGDLFWRLINPGVESVLKLRQGQASGEAARADQ
ncbi:TetR/AcrR family transcriptional regulator [Ktedonosporobacter rubrisoli]|nr:TetR/AcrR family transcriptional regulator [Ktedonosporobacter rubrisoli]